MATYRGAVCSITENIGITAGMYFPAPADEYDSNHAFLYFYTTYRYGGVLDPFPSPPAPSGGAVNRTNAAGTFVKAP